jgi:monofunctional biosynthetic peptidoglycan transglycosylase
VLGLAVLAALAFVVFEAVRWPNVRALSTQAPTSTAFIDRYRAVERQAGRPARVQWIWVPYGRIAPSLKRAVVAAEDASFFSHNGFATGEIREAFDKAVKEFGLPRGASTITQQLAKNLWLSPSRNPIRKGKEAVLTWQLETALTKRRILELYLNVVEFGPGVYGAEAASRHYFRKPAADLTPDEAAQLAAALPRPGVWHPGVNTQAYRLYVEEIRRRMDRVSIPPSHLSHETGGRLGGRIDQRQPAGGVVALAQEARRLHEDHLERRPHPPHEQMSAPRRAVGETDDHVRVHVRRLRGVQRDVAEQREDFDLLWHQDPLVVLPLRLEVAELRLAEGADRGEVRGAQTLLPGEQRQPGHHFVAFVEHQRERLLTGRVEQLRSHEPSTKCIYNATRNG